MTISPLNCPFCIRVRRGQYESRSGGVVWFEPLNPVTPGHLLFVPTVHTEWSSIGARMEMKWAIGEALRYAGGTEFNLITSCGPAATQSVAHVHLHLVPRTPGDGLALPWTGQQP